MQANAMHTAIYYGPKSYLDKPRSFTINVWSDCSQLYYEASGVLVVHDCNGWL